MNNCIRCTLIKKYSKENNCLRCRKYREELHYVANLLDVNRDKTLASNNEIAYDIIIMLYKAVNNFNTTYSKEKKIKSKVNEYV